MEMPHLFREERVIALLGFLFVNVHFQWNFWALFFSGGKKEGGGEGRREGRA